jgi:hypothetical protein
MEKESEGVEPDQRRNHEGYQHDRFPANADAVAATRREFSWGIRPAEACLSPNYTAWGGQVKRGS